MQHWSNEVLVDLIKPGLREGHNEIPPVEPCGPFPINCPYLRLDKKSYVKIIGDLNDGNSVQKYLQYSVTILVYLIQLPPGFSPPYGAPPQKNPTFLCFQSYLKNVKTWFDIFIC
jgi:hypothetical protein